YFAPGLVQGLQVLTAGGFPELNISIQGTRQDLAVVGPGELAGIRRELVQNLARVHLPQPHFLFSGMGCENHAVRRPGQGTDRRGVADHGAGHSIASRSLLRSAEFHETNDQILVGERQAPAGRAERHRSDMAPAGAGDNGPGPSSLYASRPADEGVRSKGKALDADRRFTTRFKG